MKSASNSQIKLLRKLAQRKYREKEQLFLVEGERAIEQILFNKTIQVDAVFIDENSAFNTSDFTDNCFYLDKDLITELSDTESPQGIIAVCKIPYDAKPEDFNQLSGTIIATDAIQDPGNMGTIIRTAAWFGCKALVHGKGSVDLYNPKVVRSTAGATGSLPVISGDLNQIISTLESSGWQTLLLDGGTASKPLNEIDSHKKRIIVVGNEANGIDPDLFSPGRMPVLIPSASGKNTVESLNAGIAVAIAIWGVDN